MSTYKQRYVPTEIPPLANGYSPAELMFGRSLNSMGVMPNKKIDVKRLRHFESKQRDKQESHYNSRHRVIERSQIPLGQTVKIHKNNRSTSGVVIATRGREVVASKDSGVLVRRNRSQISSKAPANEHHSQNSLPHPDSKEAPNISRSSAVEAAENSVCCSNNTQSIISRLKRFVSPLESRSPARLFVKPDLVVGLRHQIDLTCNCSICIYVYMLYVSACIHSS